MGCVMLEGGWAKMCVGDWGCGAPWKAPGRAVLLALAALLLPLQHGAVGQTRGDFVDAFAGEWRTLSGNFTGSGERCALSLAADEGSPLPLTNDGCMRELAPASAWEIEAGQIVLYDPNGRELARLGGNQRRLNGSTLDGNAIVLERQDGPFAIAEVGCVYLGYTSSCAGLDDIATPRVEDGAQISVLTRANMRATASLSADVLDIVPANTCLPVSRCTAGPDGSWCETRFENRTGWIKKQSIRLDRFPTIVFANEC